MYRGRPPSREYPPPFEGRGPPPARPYPAAGYREERNRSRPPLYAPEPYRRSPPRRRYPSPGSGTHRGGEYWHGAPQRGSSPSPRGAVPLDHNLVITVGNELTGQSSSTSSRHHDRDYEYRRSQSRGRSRPRSHSRERSPDRSRGRSKSRARSRSPDRSRAKSRGRSKSRPLSKSRSRSRSRSRGRSRGRSTGGSYSRAASHARSKSRQRSRSRSASSRSGSRSHSDGDEAKKPFRELEKARRRKELEELLSQPTKSILKKRNDSEDSPTLMSVDSPRAVEGHNMSRVADRLLQAVKGMEPHTMAAMLSELRSDPQMAQRVGLDDEIKEILNLLSGSASGSKAQDKPSDDIDDEEKFLYGDSEEPRPQSSTQPSGHQGLSELYGDLTEEALYGDFSPQGTVKGQPYGLPPGASPHLSAPSTTAEVDMRYQSRPTVDPDHNIKVKVLNPAIPPGMEPLEESERQAVEEYEKIQDLLKTIGLDLGVAEIGKMAARTKERLHGTKPPPKTPTRRRRYSSGSSADSRESGKRRRRSHSGSSSSSSSSSRSRSRSRGASWSSHDRPKKSSPPPKFRSGKDARPEKSSAAVPAVHKEPPPQPNLDPKAILPPPSIPMPTFPSPQIHGMMPPNYPPPGYGQYGNFMPYMHQQWPPMYPPPSMTIPPPSPEEFPPPLAYKQHYNNPLPDKDSSKSSTHDDEKGSGRVGGERRISEEQNRENQKQKVLEERESLRQEREVRMKRKEYLMKELERLRKQQGELLRKKRREKDGHKDPLLQEISRLQEEVMVQISNLRKEHEMAEKKRSEIDKVALILGLNPSDRPRKASKSEEDQEQLPAEKKKREQDRSPEGHQADRAAKLKQSASSAPSPSPRATPDNSHPSAAAASTPPPIPPEPFEYYDAGNHWCKNCNVTSGSMFDFFMHLHCKMHKKTLDPYDRPWASTPTKTVKNLPPEEKLTKPAKGSEFLLPVRAYFCLLCKEFYGDPICAEEHVTTHAHNEKYKKQMYENPLYEQRRNLDRQAGLAKDTSGKKRKHEDERDSKEKEEKSKQKKEKKKNEKEDDSGQQDEEPQFKKEDEDEELKLSKKVEDFIGAKREEEERYGKKDDSDKYKYSKKDDKYRYSREEEERAKYSKRVEEDRYKYNREEDRYYYRREDERYDNRPKYSSRDEGDKYKYSRYSDSRSKYDREREDEKLKTEKKPEPGKSGWMLEAKKQLENPLKPYDPPKILCGPSPAMKAKLRKQNLEMGKPAPSPPVPTTITTTTTMPTFGKFTWKKRENVLAKEAERVAAEFIKEDEAPPVSVEDSFAKSVAVAKEIAEKLTGQPTTPPPWAWSNGANRGRIRPNLQAPAAVMRKAAMTGKPAPLNTFLSMRPQTATTPGPQLKRTALFPEEITTASSSQGELLEAKPVTLGDELAPALDQPSLPEVRPAPSEAKPAPSEAKPAPSEAKPAPSEAKPAPLEAKPAPPEAKPALASPSEKMIKIVSDVAAPGVPESEQTCTVFVKPPPFMNTGDGAQRSEKLKSNLAAANAQDLFGIFYSSTSQPGPSSFAKSALDVGKKSPFLGSQTPKPPLASQSQLQTQPQTQSEPKTQSPVQPHTQSQAKNKPQAQPVAQSQPKIQPVTQLLQSPQTQLQPAPQPESFQDPQPCPGPKPEPAPSQPALQPDPPLPSLAVPVQSDTQTEPEGQESKLVQSQSCPKIDVKIDPICEIKPHPQHQQAQPPQTQMETQTVLQNEPQADPEETQPQPLPETVSEPEPKPSTKTRGKTTPPKKKQQPPPRPVRQTRYQTRRQQLHQSQSEFEADLVSDNQESTSAATEIEVTDQGSGTQPEEAAPVENEPQILEVTPETLGLPSDMTSLDFEYDFNFE